MTPEQKTVLIVTAAVASAAMAGVIGLAFKAQALWPGVVIGGIVTGLLAFVLTGLLTYFWVHRGDRDA